MNLHHAIATLCLLGLTGLPAQNVPQDDPEDPVQQAIREFNQRDRGKPNEVTVVLPPPEAPAAPAAEKEAATPPATEAPSTPASDGTAPDPETTAEPAPATPPKGPAVRVATLQTGNGTVDGGEVKLLAPFPAKPLATTPAGWKLETAEDAPPFTREVELPAGRKITLTIRPHLLVPAADGATTFGVAEPGFDSSRGYRQDATVGAVLSRSIRQLDDDAKALGSAIDNLQQLLVSLPKPPAPKPPAAATPPEPKPASKR